MSNVLHIMTAMLNTRVIVRRVLPGLAWLLAFRFPLLPSFGLDPSWELAMPFFFKQGAQFGRDVLFTYGPLGWTALFHSYDRDLFVWQLVFQAVYATACLCLLLSGTRRWPALTQAFFWGMFILFLTQEQELVFLTALLFGFLGLIDRDESGRLEVSHWVMPLFAAGLSLVKATFFFVTVVSFLIAGVYLLARKAPGRLARAAGLYGFALLVAYLLCGQDVRAAADYVAGCLDISLPYLEGMYLPVFLLIGMETFAGVTQTGLMALVVLMSVFFLIHSRFRPQTLAKGLLYWLFLVLVWKHGLTRHPMEIIHWMMAMLPVMGRLAGDPEAPLFIKWRKEAAWRWTRQEPSLVLGAAVFVPAVILVAYASSLFPIPRFVGKNVYAFVMPHSRAAYENERARLSRLHALPSMRAIIGEGSVDALGQNQHKVFYNDFRYTPRPMFQSYSVYSEKLARANHAFLKSERAPDFMIIDMETIDNRLPLQSDSLAWLDVADDYEWVCDENNTALWRRRADGGGRFRLEQTACGTTRLMEFVSLPDGPVWLRVDIRLSLFGEARKLAGWPPVFYLDVKMKDGTITSFRLIRDIARAGFVVSPVIKSRDEFRRFAESGEGRTPESFRVRASSALCVAPEYDYDISLIKNISACVDTAPAPVPQ
ncbi:MAG: hypothetical protein LBI02_01530 [Opitutaceae bacterium]|jgi:hypothetical protein|nr:hypothetical protein [Opitutaceae bacterium]